ncbi:nitrate reductase molybdenum cofactor assembly chaperone [Brachybacterium avium]|uniref:Nitrate reductase molybdenum cofactor assembly chaperone n=1 Tax=Brachybacterium avium TaxID=2017485 RepID=A0A220U921_9MICO|nr:nitrate reductase molybdenum cofactor assembly chaperone [Brachybacterium avium]ASK64535.1 nitrate reductase molybdenum cofactor assembly chaperone [Brachybacterium avium]
MGLLSRVLERRGAEVPLAQKRDPLHASGLSDAELRATWICASWLLGYPDAALLGQADVIRRLAEDLPEQTGSGLLAGLEAIGALPLTELQSRYVDTFDTRRRGCLYLTYFSQGDTRRRGMALVRIKQDFRAAGAEVGNNELPDHLPTVLEFAAAYDAERGAKILRTNRPGLELLRIHLQEIDSPWHGVLEAISETLPPLDMEDREAVMRLAAEGPDDETVGLDGYGQEEDAAAVAAHTMAAPSSCDHDATAGAVPIELTKGPRR